MSIPKRIGSIARSWPRPPSRFGSSSLRSKSTPIDWQVCRSASAGTRSDSSLAVVIWLILPLEMRLWRTILLRSLPRTAPAAGAARAGASKRRPCDRTAMHNTAASGAAPGRCLHCNGPPPCDRSRHPGGPALPGDVRQPPTGRRPHLVIGRSRVREAPGRSQSAFTEGIFPAWISCRSGDYLRLLIVAAGTRRRRRPRRPRTASLPRT